MSNFPGETTEDITDHLRPAMRKKTDAIMMHAGTSDLKNDVNSMKYVRSIKKITEKMKDDGDSQVGFSGITDRRNHNLVEKIKGINERLNRCCNSKGSLL